MLVMFSSTYICESAFSIMKQIKSNIQNRMTDETLDACLCLSATDIKANIDTIIKIKKQLIVLPLCWSVVYFFFFWKQSLSWVIGKQKAFKLYSNPKLC